MAWIRPPSEKNSTFNARSDSMSRPTPGTQHRVPNYILAALQPKCMQSSAATIRFTTFRAANGIRLSSKKRPATFWKRSQARTEPEDESRMRFAQAKQSAPTEARIEMIRVRSNPEQVATYRRLLTLDGKANSPTKCCNFFGQ